MFSTVKFIGGYTIIEEIAQQMRLLKTFCSVLEIHAPNVIEKYLFILSQHNSWSFLLTWNLDTKTL